MVPGQSSWCDAAAARWAAGEREPEAPEHGVWLNPTRGSAQPRPQRPEAGKGSVVMDTVTVGT